MHKQLNLPINAKYRRRYSGPKEFKLVSLRDCPVPADMASVEEPAAAVYYWRRHIELHDYFDPERECFVVLLLNTRRRVKGHQLLSHGSVDTILVHPREVFRAAVLAAASAVVLMHNHPSGDPAPSEADIRTTGELQRAGAVVKIEVLDHIIVGRPGYCSLRALGYLTV